jgi:hypothetical protein
MRYNPISRQLKELADGLTPDEINNVAKAIAQSKQRTANDVLQVVKPYLLALKELCQHYFASRCGDIDSGYFQDLMVKHGVFVEVETPEEYKKPIYQQTQWFKTNPELTELIGEVKE